MVRSILALSVFLLSAAPAQTAPARCGATMYAPAGRWQTDRPTGGAGLVLSGAGLTGMPHAPVFAWLRAHFIAPASARAGNLVILKASGGRDYSDDFYREGRFASVREVLIPPCASRSQADRAAPYVERADIVLFAGGDQANYVRWKGSKLIAAVKGVYARGGIVGGGSAGLAIQGAVVYDSVAADRILPDDEEVHTADAVRNPMERAISFTTNLFAWPPLANTITDTHFARRDRFGRLAAFMARALQERLVNGDRIYGVAVDEDAVLLVDSTGVATLYQRAREEGGYVPQGAWILMGSRSRRLRPGLPLSYTVEVTHLQHNGARYNLPAKKGGGRSYRVTVNGSRTPPYTPADPYR